MSVNYKMDRIADPRTYICAVEQSIEPTEFLLDPVKYSYCEKHSVVMTEDVEKPIMTPEQCFASRRTARGGQAVPPQK